MKTYNVQKIKKLPKLIFFKHRDLLIKNSIVGFGVGAFYGLTKGSYVVTLAMGIVFACIIGPLKTYSDLREIELKIREKFDRLLGIWMQGVLLMITSGAHPIIAVRKSAESCLEHHQFVLLSESLMSVGDLYQALNALSDYGSCLELQRFNSRILLYETQGNSMILQLMEGDMNSYIEKQTEQGQLKIEKSILRQALPSLLIFATIMVHMMSPLLLGGI